MFGFGVWSDNTFFWLGRHWCFDQSSWIKVLSLGKTESQQNGSQIGNHFWSKIYVLSTCWHMEFQAPPDPLTSTLSSALAEGVERSDGEVARCLRGRKFGKILPTWGFPKIMVPNNYWFSMVFLLKMTILIHFGVEIGGYHQFRETPILGKVLQNKEAWSHLEIDYRLKWLLHQW